MYFKITNEIEKHHGMQYQDGLNVDILPFNGTTDSCVPGGLYFTDEKSLYRFLSYGEWVREVTIPEDAEFVKDLSGDKWRANKIILGERRSIYEIDTWEWLSNNGVNIDNDEIVEMLFTSNDCREVFKFLQKRNIELGHYLSCITDYKISGDEKIEILKQILATKPDKKEIEQGFNICVFMDESIEVLKVFIQAGVSVYCPEYDPPYGIMTALDNSLNDIVEFLFSYIPSVYHEEFLNEMKGCCWDEDLIEWVENQIEDEKQRLLKTYKVEEN